MVRRRRLRGGIFSSSLWALRSLTILWSTSAYYVQDPCSVPQRARFSRLFNFWLKRRSCCCCCRHRCCRIERDGAGFCLFSFVSFLPSWPTQTHALSIPCYHIKTSCWFSFIRSTGLLVCRGNRQRISARQSRSISSSSSSSSSSISSSFSFRRCIPSYSFARQPSPRAFGTLFAPVFLPSGNKKRKGAKRVGGRRRRRH